MLRTAIALLLVALLSARAADTKGKRLALVVGVNAYRNAAFTPLDFAENDAEELKVVLGRAGFSVTLLTTREGKKDTAKVPTAANIRKAVEALVSGRGEADTVLICLAGHGVQLEVEDPEGKEKSRTYAYFCPSDAETTQVSLSTGNSPHLISLNWLLRRLESSTAGKKLVMVDACRNPGKAIAAARGIDAKKVTVPDGVCALFSCGPGQVAYELRGLGERGGHGVFFHYVLEGLRGKAKNADGEVTWGGLAEYVTRQVSREVPRRVRPSARQTPHLVTNLVGESPVLVDRPAPARVVHRRSTRKATFPGEKDYQRGLDYREGRGTRPDRAKAAEHFRKAADAGHPFARARVALDRWSERDASPEVYRLGAACYLELRTLARDRSNPEAMLHLADLLYWGVGVVRDREEAGRLTLAAAQMGHGPAQLRVGVEIESYYIGPKQDYGAALGWYRKAAERGEARALDRIGLLYLDGRGVAKDEEEAANWFRKAAEAGCWAGRLHLALMYLGGRGVPKSEEEAFRLIDKDDPATQVQVGCAYRNGTIVAKDPAESVEWFRKAAEAGHAMGQYHLGEAHRRGEGVGRCEKEAARWLRKAAEQPCAPAMLAVGELYERGQGVEKSLAQARAWYRRAAAHGSAGARLALPWAARAEGARAGVGEDGDGVARVRGRSCSGE